MKVFEEEEDLAKTLITEVNGQELDEIYKGQSLREGEGQEVINGCPDCLTDAYLVDLVD
jgi:hypothetical protein